jgi:hypothetical protein
LAHIQGHTAVVAFDPAPEHKGFIEVDEVGMVVKGLREDVGLEDGGYVLKGDKLHELLVTGYHGSARPGSR